MGVGLLLGILQQVTGINAIYFYATSIFKQTGIGTDAAFSSGVLLSFTLDEKAATAYSLFIVGFGALVGGLKQNRNNNVDWKTAITFGIPSIF